MVSEVYFEVVMDFNEFCKSSLQDFKHEEGYMTGFVEGTVADYEDFYTKLNNLCVGFVRRRSSTKSGISLLIQLIINP